MRASIQEVWSELSGNLRQFILGKVQNDAVAEDLLHDVYLKIHHHIDSLRDETRIQSWIYQITRNTITDYFRQIKKASIVLRPPGEDMEEDFSQMMEETLHDMIQALDELSEEDCEALCLTEIEGMSQVEYARRIGISYSGAKSRIQRARLKLRDGLMKCCHYEFDRYGTVIDIAPLNCCCCH